MKIKVRLRRWRR